MKHYWTDDEITAALATPAFSPQRVELIRRIGPFAGFNEGRSIRGFDEEGQWDAVTGRIGLDFKVTDEVLLYGFFSRGYKPGGFNPSVNSAFTQTVDEYTFNEEKVDAIEVGFKSTLLDGTLVLNGTAFVYDYKDLQVTRIKYNSSINENIDADISGLELEWVWRPEDIENFTLDGSFSYLDTSVGDVTSIDVTNKAAGNPDFVNLKNIDLGASTGENYIADATKITPDIIARAVAANDALAGGVDEDMEPLPGISYPADSDGKRIPVYFSREFLEAAPGEGEDGMPTGGIGMANVNSGIPISISGNQLPNAPEYTFRLGAQYTWPLASAGNLTLRWDFYWQDDSYAREFNTGGDKIESWDQHNMSLIFESANDDWQVKAFIRNLQDEDNVTGHYLTSDTSGFFRNYFLTEPRIYGLSVRYGFGGE